MPIHPPRKRKPTVKSKSGVLTIVVAIVVIHSITVLATVVRPVSKSLIIKPPKKYLNLARFYKY